MFCDSRTDETSSVEHIINEKFERDNYGLFSFLDSPIYIDNLSSKYFLLKNLVVYNDSNYNIKNLRYLRYLRYFQRSIIHDHIFETIFPFRYINETHITFHIKLNSIHFESQFNTILSSEVNLIGKMKGKLGMNYT